jgi:hypothetical protein
MRIYLSGPMTGVRDQNRPLFHAEAKRLRELGYDVVSPAEICPDPKASWEACVRADIAQLVYCHGIAMLPDWERSRGARLEYHIATQLGMPVFIASEIAADRLMERIAA